jgi:hypothetical protein
MVFGRFLMDQSFDLIESGYRFLAARNDILWCVELCLEKVSYRLGP